MDVWICFFNYLSLGGNILQIFRSNNNLGVALIRTWDFWLTKNFDQIVSILIANIKMFWYLILAEGAILGLSIYGFLEGKIITKIKPILPKKSIANHETSKPQTTAKIMSFLFIIIELV